MRDKIADFLHNKKILILGLGREGRSTLDFIKRSVPCADVTVADGDPNMAHEYLCSGAFSETLGCRAVFGPSYLEGLQDYDVIIKSPGIALKDSVGPDIKARITSQTDLFLRFRTCRVIGVTGTKGKSTTSSLIYHILSHLGVKSCLVGNIGVPVLSQLEHIDTHTVAVYELSCHQLEYVRASADIAVLLNIYSDHLDHYGSFEDYRRAKYNIFAYQGPDDTLIVSGDCENIDLDMIDALPMRKIYLDSDRGLSHVIFADDHIELCGEYIPLDKIKTSLIGRHNLYDIAAAMAAAKQVGCSAEDMLSVIPSFKGLEHRLELVAQIDGVKYYNDSISTIPEATERAIEALKDVTTLIIGGMDRGIDYDGFARYLVRSDVRNIICAYASGDRIYGIISRLKPKNNIYRVEDLSQAVALARTITDTGSCLLSPAAASYGYFKNFEDRGRCFKRLVRSGC